MSFNKLQNVEFETGDIILFSSHNTAIDSCIKCWTCSPYTHTAIILKNPTWLHKDLIGIYIIESGYESTPEVLTKKFIFGVQIQKLQTVLANYNGKLFYRKLHCIRNEEFYSKLKQIINVVNYDPYDINPMDWIRAELHVKIGNCRRTHTFWCSALTAYIYTKLGFLSDNTLWSLISPKQFGKSSCFTSSLKFTNCILDKPVYIKII
jgi:hypothetical protein